MTAVADDTAPAEALPTRRQADGRWFTNTDPALRKCWHPVAAAADVTETPMQVTLLGQDWVLVRIDGELVVMEDRCPHRFAPLSFGTVADGTLECPYHGWRFASTGRCVRIPAEAQDIPIPVKARCTVPAGIQERYELIWLAPEPPITPLPAIPEWGDTSLVAVFIPVLDWNATAAQMADNFIDMTHLPFAHRNTIGDPDDQLMPNYRVDRDGWTFSVVLEHSAKRLADSIAPGDEFTRERRRLTFVATAPHHVYLRIEYLDTGIVMVSTFFHQPVDENTTKLWTWNLRSDIADGRATAADAVAFQAAVGAEDRLMLERLKVKAIPLDLTIEMHTNADRATVELRRLLHELVEAAQS
jgi:phenylpropionate dioxygenase-like ring-hydroxylating dioxygenase large terminal subunit